MSKSPHRALQAVVRNAKFGLLAYEIPKISGPRASNPLNPDSLRPPKASNPLSPDKDKAIFGASNPLKPGHTFRGASGGLSAPLQFPDGRIT